MSEEKAKKIAIEKWRFDDLSTEVLEAMTGVCDVLNRALEQLPRNQNTFGMQASAFSKVGSEQKGANLLVKIQNDYDGVIEVEPIDPNPAMVQIGGSQYQITIPDKDVFQYFCDLLVYWSFQRMGRQTPRPPLPKSYQTPSPDYPPEVNAEVEKRFNKEEGKKPRPIKRTGEHSHIRSFLNPWGQSSTQPGIGDQALRDEDIKILEKGLEDGKVIKWHCAVCRTFIRDLDSIEVLREELQNIERGNYKKCPRHGHENSFSVRDGHIVFQNQPLPLEKVLVDKSPVDKGKQDAKITTESKKIEPSK